MPPILFSLAGPNRNKQINAQRGIPPTLCGVFLLPVAQLGISGVTRDSAGVALAGCTVHLFRTADDLLMEVAISDGAGAFTFGTVGLGESYYVVAYLAGSPDVAGTSVNTLVGA